MAKDLGSVALAVRRRSSRWSEPVRLVVGIIAAGVVSGVAAAVLTLILRLVQHIAFGYHDSPFIFGVETASPLRRILAPTVGAALSGLIWAWLRRRPLPSISDGMAVRPVRLPTRRTLLDAVVQILAVGTGSSVGREGAPRQAAAALTFRVASALTLPAQTRRMLVAAAAGAGLAAVYNVPLSGAAYALEVLAIGMRRRHAVATISVSVLATIVARPVVTGAPTYTYPTRLGVPGSTWVWAVVAIPAAAALGRGFRIIASRAARIQPEPGWRLPALMAAGGLVLGVLSVWLPALPGNGKGVVQLTMIGSGTALVFALLVVLKPGVTALSIGTGATGGLLTPSMATGAALGAAAAYASHALGASLELPSFALVAAVGVLAASQDAPWFAAVMGWELSHPPLLMALPLLVVSWGSVLVSRSATRWWRRRVGPLGGGAGDGSRHGDVAELRGEGDVPTVVRSVEIDPGDRGIDPPAGLGEGVAEGDDGQDPAAG